MDIIIPLAKDKKSNYYELRMTLRSIEKNLSGYRNIYLIGEKPSWVTNVTHIPLNDLPGKKAFSIFRKIMTAAKEETVSDNFIAWADDTYLLEPLPATEIKDWYDNTLKHWTHLNINSLYRQIIKNTWNLFPDGLFYNVHAPCIYDKGRFQELSKYDFSTTGLLTKSTYFNSRESNPVQMKDPKRQRGLFMSTCEKVSVEEQKLLGSLFPNPSIYETHNKANAKTTPGMAKVTG